MKISKSLYKHHRFPPEIIQHAAWLYYRFNLSCRDIEDLLAERGITVSYESIRLWCLKFGSKYAKRLRRRHQGYGDTEPLKGATTPSTGENPETALVGEPCRLHGSNS